MTVRAVFVPLVSGVTYRRAVHLVLGGVILLPYVLLGVVFHEMWTTPGTPRAATVVLLAAAAVITAVPAFLRGTRGLEIAAARALLGVRLPDPEPTGIRQWDRETRLRAALWFALHLLFGGLVGVGLLLALPMALLLVAQRFAGTAGGLAGLRIDMLDTWSLTFIGLGLLVLLVYAIAALGALAAVMAPVLLGPSAAERIAAVEARNRELAVRNRLARELHDSIGHALTVATVQAAAARELFATDPQFAWRALTAIEETGRAAMDELDQVLALLREPEPDRDPPQWTLDNLDRLVADVRAAGIEVIVDATGPLDELPAVASREGFRIVQEALTNVVRHGRGTPVALRLNASDGGLDIEVTNDAGGPPAHTRAGRGLAGIRERVTLLGGRVSAGPADGQWRVAVHLPAGRTPQR